MLAGTFSVHKMMMVSNKLGQILCNEIEYLGTKITALFIDDINYFSLKLNTLKQR